MSDIRKNVFETLRQFCLQTSIHAFYYIVHSRKKIFWSILSAISIAVCTWQCSLNVLQYLRFDIKTTVITESFESADFPAIDFCPTYGIKRNSFCQIENYEFFLATIFEENENKFTNLVEENTKSCKRTANDATISMQQGINEITNWKIQFGGSYFTIFRDILLQCKWKNEPFDCDTAFMDHQHATKAGNCFAFNEGARMASHFLQVHEAANINLTAYKESKFQVNSVQPTLQLMMMINQSNQCGNEEIKSGSGISLTVFGKHQWTSELTNAYTHISPGYKTDVSIQMVKFNRNTEHLGRCVKSKDLYLLPNETNYILNACLGQCAGELGIQFCQCLMPQLRSYRDRFQEKMRTVNHDVDVHICETPAEIKCLKKMYRNQMSESFLHLCHKCQCPMPCNEEFYRVQTTTSLFTRSYFNQDILRNVSDEEFRKNYFAIDFHFATMTAEIVEESQAFTRQDMFVYLGNNIILFLGMSFTSSFEVPILVLRLLHLSLGGVGSLRKKLISKIRNLNWPAKKPDKIKNRKTYKRKQRRVHPVRGNPAVIHL